MKRISTRFCMLVVFGVFSVALTFAQPPQSVPYQAVARNLAGNLIVGQTLGLRLTIHSGSAAGPIVYQERQTPGTNSLGLFSINIGTGTVLSGTFSSIAWSSNSFYLDVELDPAGGTSYTDMGTHQMMSVPYALAAGSAPGDNWGVQTAAVTAPITGNGSAGSPLNINANSSASSGVVAAGTGHNTKVWGTDASGNPGWVAANTEFTSSNLTDPTGVMSISGGAGSVLGTGTTITANTNALNQAGIVTAGTGHATQVWGTDASGNPGWTAATNEFTHANLTEATSSVLTITNGTGAVVGTGTTIQVKANAVNQAGTVAAPTAASNPSQVWATDASGNPTWKTLSQNAVEVGITSGSITKAGGAAIAAIPGLSYTFTPAVSGLVQITAVMQVEMSTGTYATYAFPELYIYNSVTASYGYAGGVFTQNGYTYGPEPNQQLVGTFSFAVTAGTSYTFAVYGYNGGSASYSAVMGSLGGLPATMAITYIHQ